MTVLDRVDPVTIPRLLADPNVGAGLSEHRRLFGPMPVVATETMLAALEASGLRGRGGAGFPTGRKFRTVAAARRPVVVVNALEGEPASAKDTLLCTRRPHLVLDGVLVALRTVEARRAHVAVHCGSPAAAALRRALAERDDLSGVTVSVDEAPARYVASEESALVSWLDGREAKPTFPHRPFERGVGGRPTLVNNAETLAQVALIARYGPDWFRGVGQPDEPGTALVTVGVGARATVLEVPVGARLGAVLESVGWQEVAVSAVLVGGYFGRWLPADRAWSASLSHTGLRAVGGLLGAGVLIPVRPSACGLAETAHVLRYLAAENAGQCGPCVFGLPSVADAFAALSAGELTSERMSALSRWLDVVPGRGACRHPDGALALASTALTTFSDDVRDHLDGRPCAAARLGARMLPAPSDSSDREWR